MEKSDKIFVKMMKVEIKKIEKIFKEEKKYENYARMAEIDSYKEGLKQALEFFGAAKKMNTEKYNTLFSENDTKKKQMKKGKYYIGDPCYIFDKSWSEILEETDYFTEKYFEINKMKCFSDSTAYGDGTYHDKEGFEYPVDSGTIGIIPVKLLKLDNKLTEKTIVEEKYGRIVNMKEDFDCVCEDGIFEFGDISINTKNPENEGEENE